MDRGTDIVIAGGVGATGGFLVAGPPGAAPGLTAMAFGGNVFGFGSATATVSGFGLGALGDPRSGAMTVLDVLGGRVLKRIPDELAPGLAQSVTDFQNSIIDFVDGLDGFKDDFPVCSK